MEKVMEKIERQGTVNNINDLYEDSYKELYLKKCDEFNYLKQLYECEIELNEKLRKQNDALQFIVRNKKLFKSFS